MAYKQLSPIIVAEGGTGATTLTDHGVLVGSATGAITALSAATDGQIIIGSSGADPAVGSLTSTGSSLTITAGAGTLNVDINAPVSVANGGTGATTLTDGGILLGSGTSAITATSQPTNGQLLIGSTGSDPVLATLTAGTDISITEGAGSITINATGGGDVSGPVSSTDNALARWDGTSGDTLQDSTVIVTDNGEMTNASQPAFYAYLATDDLNETGDGTQFYLGDTDVGTALTEVFDQNSDFTNGASGGAFFTAPVSGRYDLGGGIFLAGLTSSHTTGLWVLETSNNTISLNQSQMFNQFSAASTLALTSQFFSDMDAMDTAKIYISVQNGTKVVDIRGVKTTSFCGKLIC